MRYLFDVGHPAHVHYFRNLAMSLAEKGHSILFTARDKEVTLDLLNHYQLPYRIVGRPCAGSLRKALALISVTFKILVISLKYKPDMLLNASPSAAFVSWLMRKPHIALEDTFNMEQVGLYLPFTSVVLTGDYPHRSLGIKEIRYPGYHELAYLHPHWFQPDPSIFSDMGLKDGDRYAVLRFISWEASHDIGQSGFTYENKIKLVSELAKLLKVYVSAEGIIPTGLENMTLPVSPEKIHDLLYYAHLYIGEGATMAEESSVLGTPSILLTSCNKGSLIPDLEKYDLIKFFTNSPEDQNKAIQVAITYARSDSIKPLQRENRQSMLADKIDVTSFLIWFVEDYPDSRIKLQAGKVDFASFR